MQNLCLSIPNLNYIQELLKSKTLTEISFLHNKDLVRAGHLVDYIVNNLPMNIRKISFGGLMCIKDEHLAIMNEKNENLSINHLEFRGCLGKIDPNYSIKPENGFWDVQIEQLELFPSMADKPYRHWHIC